MPQGPAKVSDLTALAGTDAAETDLFHVVDVSEAQAADQNKKMTLAELRKALGFGLIPGAGAELTVASGAVVPTNGMHAVDTESDAASDDLDTLTATNAVAGDVVTLQAANSARTVVVKDGTGNIQCGGDRTLDNAQDTVTLRYDGSNWLEIAFAGNAA